MGRGLGGGVMGAQVGLVAGDGGGACPCDLVVTPSFFAQFCKSLCTH